MNDKMPQRRGLGRGLGSLIPSGPPPEEREAGETAAPGTVGVIEARETREVPQPSGPPVASRPGAGRPAVPPVHSFTGGGPDWIGGQARPASPQDSSAPEVPARSSVPVEAAGASGETPAAGEDDEGLRPVEGAYFAELPVEQIVPNPRQPRQVFDEEAMAELVHSIKEIGLLQPVVVRATGPDSYELIMGERRWRATQEAGLSTIPAIVRSTHDDDLLRDALLENLHRSQLNPLEEAAAYQQLLEDFGCTHEELASRIGRSRPQISNTIRLLRLSPEVQRRVAAGVLSAGHARTLLGVSEPAAQDRLAGRVVAEGISVRGLEELVALGEFGEEAQPRPRRTRPTAPGVDDLAARLTDLFETRVKVDLGKSKGRITIEFASVADLERIVATMDPTFTPRHGDMSTN